MPSPQQNAPYTGQEHEQDQHEGVGRLRVTGHRNTHEKDDRKPVLDMEDLFGDELIAEFRKSLEQRKTRHITKFHLRGLDNSLAEKEALRFLYDADATGRFDPGTRIAMQQLIDKKLFTATEITAFSQDLDVCRETARVSFSNQDLDIHNNKALSAVDRAAMDIMATKHPHLPLPEALYGTETQNQAIKDLSDFYLKLITSNTQVDDAVTDAAKAITALAEDISRYNTTGQHPDWCNPDRTTIAPEHRDKGCNWIMNRPFNPFAHHEENVKYLEERLDLAFGPGRPMELSYAEAGRMMLQQHLDHSLTAQRHLYDPDDWYYWDDGPVNYQEEITHRFLDGNPQNPVKHAEVSYARLVRDSLMARGIVDDIGLKRPETLAMSLSRSAAALARLSATLHEAVENPPERQDSAPVDIPVKWDMTPAERWKKLLNLTHDLTTTTTFRSNLNRALEQIVRHTTSDDRVDTDSIIGRYNFVPRTEVHPNTDADHPHRILLQEAIADLHEAGHMLDQIDQHQDEATKHRQSRRIAADTNLRRYEKEGRSPQFVKDMRDYLENDFIHQPGRFGEEHIYRDIQGQVEEELRQNGFTNARELTTDGKKTTLFDHAARLTAHADFNLRAIDFPDISTG